MDNVDHPARKESLSFMPTLHPITSAST